MEEPDPHAALSDALGGATPPGGVRALPDDVVADLAALVAAARAAQRAELRHASQNSLRHVPRLARGPLKKVLGI